ncbi:uncharacterized protein LOC111688096 [Lucilia cuprina]|uniref:uncharacterized protein LOC111688096 n=1 Tax=Lucilia cuprina TaxID=7375 RepID=UPI001F051993|nr:uncharacterized protein LOC111688096 [Lucilia cuprina]
MMGDFNAQVGSENVNVESTMGRHGLGRLTENGKMFLETCRTNNLVIGGTLFPYPRVHKVTWVSPDCRTENQIDHITISRKWRGSLLDVRNKRGADIASDHHLLVATVRIKITAIRTNNTVFQRRFNVAKLKTPEIANLFSNELSGCASINRETQTWQHVREIFTKSAEKHLGFKTTGRREWISDTKWNLIQQRKVAKNAVHTSKTRSNKATQQHLYTRLNSEVKRSARKDKRNWTNNIANELQAAAETHRLKDLYITVNKLTNRKLSTGKPLRNDAWELITSKTQQVTLWESFYSGMLSTPTAQCQPICECASHTPNTSISTDCPGISEISNSIRSLKPNKSPGLDKISPELLTADRTTSARLLEPIIRAFWTHESLPDELSDGVIINLPKKGDLTNRKNWRGITLLSMVNKVIAHIINNRLSTTISQSLRNEQAGFRSGKSCVDQVNSLRIIVKQLKN